MKEMTDKTIDAFCLHNNELKYRQEQPEGHANCLLEENRCPYFKQKKNVVYCTNYSKQYRKPYK